MIKISRKSYQTISCILNRKSRRMRREPLSKQIRVLGEMSSIRHGIIPLATRAASRVVFVEWHITPSWNQGKALRIISPPCLR